MKGRRNPFVAQEGIPFLLSVALALVLAVRYFEPWTWLAVACVLVLCYLLFRDPHRVIPAAPLGVVSPVDGTVVAVDETEHGLPQGRSHHVRIRINSFGTYTARAPIEGQVRDLHSAGAHREADAQRHVLWVQTDEGDDVVLQFSGYRFGLVPRAFRGYGERVGQGERCAYLRFARFADVYLPGAGQVLVQTGQSVVAGADLIGKVPHP